MNLCYAAFAIFLLIPVGLFHFEAKYQDYVDVTIKIILNSVDNSTDITNILFVGKESAN